MKSKEKTERQFLSELSVSTNKIVKVQSKESERKQPVEKTKNKRGFVSNIIESSLDGIIAADSEGYISRANKSFLELLGYEECEVVGKHISEFSIKEIGVFELSNGDSIEINKKYFDDQNAMIANLIEGHDIRNKKSYFTRKDGKVIPCEQNISALYDEEGKVNGAVGIIRDIAERRRSEKRLEEVREFLDNIFKTAADGIMVTDSGGFIIMVNDSIEQISGYTQEDLIGKHARELRAEGKDYEEKGIEFADKLLRDGSVVDSDMPWLRKDGSLVYVERSAALLKNKEGKITGAVSTIRDVTDRKRDEKNLRETKDYLDNLIESSLDGIIVSDNSGNVTRANKYFLELIGFEEEETVGKHIMELSVMQEGTYESTTGELVELKEDFFNTSMEMSVKLFEEGKVSHWESYYLHKNGKVVPVEMNIAHLCDEQGDIIGAVGVTRDITERKKYEEALKKSEEKYQNLIENANDAVISINREGIIVTLNKKVEKMYGYTREELLGKSVVLLVPPHRREGQKKAIENLKTIPKVEGFRRTLETIAFGKDGKEFPVETSMFGSEIHGEYILTSFVRDITERQKAENEIREGKEFLEKIIKGSKDGILIGDGEGYILSANEAMEEMLGLRKDEIVGKHSSELLFDDKSEREKVLEKMRGLFENGFASYETRYKTKTSDYVEVECYLSMIKDEKGGYIAGISIVRDITERKKMQQQLLQSEKLRSLGELAGGVAHDFNNVLAAILGRAQLLKMQFKPPPGKQEKRKSMLDLIKSLEIIERASSDGAETVRRIQEFARKRSDDKDFSQVNINELLENVLEFTGVRWKDDAESKGIKINIQKEFSSLPSTLGSAAELREVFTNIINNALDAMPQGGRIQIKTLNENNHIAISIEDTGIGIPENIRSRIFDPFFTTKGVQSTGLGMSTSYGIINRHKGTISVESTEGKGTTFTINIPVAENKLEAEGKIKPILQEKKKATILVIEDEEEVRNLLADILIESGHEVRTASDGTQGIEMFKETEFDMVFTDLGMSGMSGWQVAETIKNINRKIPVAVITGWNVELPESEMRERGVNLIVQKPFEVNQILSLVQEGMELRKQFEAA